jgi:hypothetical protein
MMFRTLAIETILAAALLGAAAAIAFAAPPARPARLADTGLYADAGARTLARDVLTFSPQYPLWSDGAGKERWIRLPPNTAIDARDPDRWEFPIGTRVWKEFRFEGRRIETRMLERVADGSWAYAAYVWNAAGTDATLASPSGAPTDAEVAPGIFHRVPGAADCRACHEGEPSPVLGFSLLQLSPDRDPRAPHTETPPPDAVDLRALVARGLVQGLPGRFIEHPPRIAAATPDARAALGYLHANCGGCHNADGPLAAELDMRLAQHVADDDSARPMLASTVACPTHASLAGGAHPLRVAPAHPDASYLAQRMASREPSLQMPPLGSDLVDDAGLALVRRWIAALPSSTKRTCKPQPEQENRP